MADNSLTISCAQSGASWTSDINDALESLNTMFAGDVEPTNNQEDGQMWLDTSGADKIIRIRIGGIYHSLLDFDGTDWFAERAKEATKLAVARTISLTGGITASGTFDGSGDLTLETSIDTSGTWTGNAISATTATNAGTSTAADKWTSARTVTLAGDLSGNVTFDGSNNTTLTATITGGINVNNIGAGGTLADGKILTGSSSTAYQWEDPGAAGGVLLHQMTGGSGTFIVPEGVTRLIVTGAGSGGTGTRVSEGFNASGGGGAGGCCVRTQVAVTSGATISWTVAASVAGRGGTTTGNTGNSTTVSGGGVEITLGGGGRGTSTGGAGGGGSASVSGGSANSSFTGNGGGGGAQTAGGGGGSNFWGPSGTSLSGPGSVTDSGGSGSSNGIGPGAGGGGCAGTGGNCSSSQAGALIIEIGVV